MRVTACATERDESRARARAAPGRRGDHDSFVLTGAAAESPARRSTPFDIEEAEMDMTLIDPAEPG